MVNNPEWLKGTIIIQDSMRSHEASINYSPAT